MLETAYEYDLGQYEKSIIGDGQQVQLVQAEIIPEDSINMDDTMIAPSVDDHPAQTYRSNFTVSHVIQADVDNHGQSVAAARMRNLAATALPALPFLLLDVRDEEEYERGHVVTALHYPRAMLSRASNMFTKEILQFRNQEDKVGVKVAL